MRIIPTATATLVGIVVVAIVAGGAGGAGAATAGSPQSMESCAAESPPGFADPDSGDAIGYVDGYWYDEPIVVYPPTEDPDSDDGNDTDAPSGNDTDDGGNGTTGASNGTTTEGNGTTTTGGNDTTTTDGNETASGNATTDGNGTAADGNETAAGDGSDGTDDTGSEPDATDPEPGSSRPFNASDGLDDRELEAFVARTAARVETLRCRSFESVPSVRVENRSAVQAAQRAALANRSQAMERYDGARLAAALLVGTDANATATRAETTSAATLGYYDTGTDSIVIVSGAGEETRVDEVTLAHELVHALQDQHFDLDRFDAGRTDAALAESGLIEGDASLVEHHYQQRCDDDAWATDCLGATPPATGDSGSFPLELFFFQPYNDGPHYVEGLYETGGWSAVDERYADPPTSTKPLLFPDSVAGSYQPRNVTFDPVTEPDWVRVDPAEQPATDVLGPGTIGATMLSPTFETDTGELYGAQLVTNNVDQSTLDPLHPYDYGIDAATGWRGDGLQVYRNEDGGTAVRWRTAWTSEAAATTFRERYVELLSIRDAARSRNYAGVYHFPPSSDYSGRVSVRQNGSSVVIVHAPDLEGVRTMDGQAAREPREGSSSSMSRIDASKRAAEDALSGPQGAGAIAAILGAIGLLGWGVLRRR